MAISEPYEMDGVTISTNEISIVSGTTGLQTITDDGVYQLFIDGAVFAKADEFVVRIYEKVEATGGAKRVLATFYIMGAQAQNFVTPPFLLINGWDMTIQRIAGADRAVDASIRKIA
jgi:hypothetical protein